MNNNSKLGTQVFRFFAFLEAPNCTDSRAGLAYFALFLTLGIILINGQLIYWLFLLF